MDRTTLQIVIDAKDKASTKLQKLQPQLRKVGLVGAAAFVGVGAATGTAIKQAADFEEKMADVRKVTDKETMKAMREEILQMSRDIPLTTDKLAELTEQAGRFGVEGTKNIKEFVRVVAEMAVATDLAADEAGKKLAKISSMLDLPTDAARNLGAAINTVSQNVASSSAEIVNSISNQASAVRTLGLQADEIVALSGVLNEVSQNAKRAGSRIRIMAQDFLQPSTIRKSADVFNMNADALNRMMKKTPLKMMKKFGTALANGSKKGQQLREVLSKRVINTLEKLGQNTDLFNDILKKSSQQFKDATSLSREFAIQSETTNNLMQIMKNAFNELAIRVGTAFLPMIKDATKAVISFVQGIADWVKKNPELTQSIITTTLKISGLVTATYALSAVFSAVTSKFFLVAGAVVALSTATVKLFENTNALSEGWEMLKRTAREMKLWKALRVAGKRIADTWENQLKPAILNFAEALGMQDASLRKVAKRGVQILIGAIIGFVEIVGRMVRVIGKGINFLSKVAKWFRKAASAANKLENKSKTLKRVLMLLNPVGYATREVVQKMGEGFKNATQNLRGTTEEFRKFRREMKLTTDIFGNMQMEATATKKLADKLGISVKETQRILHQSGDSDGGWWSDMREQAESFFSGFKDNMGDIPSIAKDAAGGVQDASRDILKELHDLSGGFDDVANNTKDSLKKLQDDLEQSMDRIDEQIERVETRMDDLQRSFEKSKERDVRNLVDAFVEADEKVQEIQDKIEKTEDEERVAELEKKLKEKRDVIERTSDMRERFEEKIEEAKENRAKSELEAAISKFKREREMAEKQHERKKERLEEEKEKLQEKREKEIENHKQRLEDIKKEMRKKLEAHSKELADFVKKEEDELKAAGAKHGMIEKLIENTADLRIEKSNEATDQVLDNIEKQIRAYKGLNDLFGDDGSVANVDDAHTGGVVKESGIVNLKKGEVVTNPNKNQLARAGAQKVEVNINGGNYLSEDAAVDMADEVVKRVKNKFNV